jgi:hypothetical protein
MSTGVGVFPGISDGSGVLRSGIISELDWAVFIKGVVVNSVPLRGAIEHEARNIIVKVIRRINFIASIIVPEFDAFEDQPLIISKKNAFPWIDQLGMIDRYARQTKKTTLG